NAFEQRIRELIHWQVLTIPRDSLSEKMDAKSVSLSLCGNGRGPFFASLKFMHHMNFNTR
ncbi:hypothetical protein, partial [Mesorhizobium sp. M7A.F.Ca.US.007.01.1.1]|uniref:hypothetical protein n=1 Tax=Mesorhizobium sp. M7A.F.Ca.US.007.01.1.1 TaxID=2496712 RepID=UPI0019D2EAFC